MSNLMDTIIGAIFIIILIAFWRRILTGIAGGLIFGLIGSLFGGAGTKVGFTIGFIIGITSNRDADKNDKKENDENNTTTNNSNKSNSQNNTDSKIVRCPSCKKKIRVKLPLKGSKGKCSACSSLFNIRTDDFGNIRVDRVETNDQTAKKQEEYKTISDYFSVLEVPSTATPDEVKVAYRRKIKEYHPDRVAGLGEKLKKMADEESKVINKAYSVLKSKGLAS